MKTSAKAAKKIAPKAAKKVVKKVANKVAKKITPLAKTPAQKKLTQQKKNAPGKSLAKTKVSAKATAKVVLKSKPKSAAKPAAKSAPKPVAKKILATKKAQDAKKASAGKKTAVAKTGSKTKLQAKEKSVLDNKKALVEKKLALNKKEKQVAPKEVKVKASKKEKLLMNTNKNESLAERLGEAPKAVKQRKGKGPDKNYVAPPTVAVVQTTAKLVHTPAAQIYAQSVPVIPSAIKKNSKLVDNWKSKKAHELTDAEVIAMPDEEYMNQTQLAFFHFKLCELRESLLKNAAETTEQIRDDSSVVPDPTDRATIEEEHALELRTRDRERKLLKKIQLALTRIEHRDYGYCDETGEPIGVSRLIARPTATLSLEAQQRRELKQKMFGD